MFNLYAAHTPYIEKKIQKPEGAKTNLNFWGGGEANAPLSIPLNDAQVLKQKFDAKK